MSSFKFEWWKCRDGYRIEVEAPRKMDVSGTILEGVGTEDARVIVPKSNNWDLTRPLEVEAPYRVFANWDGTDDGLLDLTNAYGSMWGEKASKEYIDYVRGHVIGIQTLVESIDAAEWQAIADTLNRAATKGRSRPGIGRLGVVFDIVDGKPEFRLRPSTLYDALRVQALFDATHGVKHKQCKNPECGLWFRIGSGPGALRSDAEYHDRDCRFRHAYLLKKEAQS
jgi:hypothetical protein